MSAKSAAPVIIKRKKPASAEGHHGGAWKVAYADFVTAMMAFFLLMWLLNATTEKQRKGLADYFNPTIAVIRVSGGGTGSLSGDSTFTKDTLARSGEGGSPGDAKADAEDPAAAETQSESFESVQEMLNASSGQTMIDDRLRRHIGTRMTDEGLVIELFDQPDAPLFDADTDRPTLVLQELATALARVLAEHPHKLAISGHVQAYPVVRAEKLAWPLSWQRGTVLRELLDAAGLEDQRFLRVTGKADRNPVALIPSAQRNNRLELVLLRQK